MLADMLGWWRGGGRRDRDRDHGGNDGGAGDVDSGYIHFLGLLTMYPKPCGL